MTTAPDQHAHPKSDIDIARVAELRPITDVVAGTLDIDQDHLEPYGRFKAKIALPFVESLKDRPDGKLILVTAITPTPAGEGKTTTTIGLGDGLRRLGKNSVVCLREPSLGPCFGQKGGATGGGYAQVVPMTDINLHFTGDFHAIGAANNLLAAMIDNHIYWGNELGLDSRRITWRRAVDINDRALRQIVGSLGGAANGFPREDAFDITVASEVMAIFCLATDLKDLRRRLGNIILGYTRDKKPVYARDIKADGAMTALLKDAFAPNVVQTLENNPAIVHGGPFANIAHGCNTALATKTALKLCDYVVTEAGFGADLGAEKFLNIKCRKAGLKPDLCVVVATIRALKMHGGVAKEDLRKDNLEALGAGLANLERHVANVQSFGLPVVVAINRFSADSRTEMALVEECCAKLGVEAVESDHWATGSAGSENLAQTVVRTIDEKPANFKVLYPDDMPLWDKVKTVAQKIYGAADIDAPASVKAAFKNLEEAGFGHYPVCIAKTQYSFSTDPSAKGAPSGHMVPVREVRLAAGAEFVVVVCGDILTMPGLPRVPAAVNIGIDDAGDIVGMF